MKPDFSQGYVIRETLKHMQRCVTISQSKTLARLSEFNDNPEKCAEVLATLSSLNRLNRLCESIMEENKGITNETPN